MDNFEQSNQLWSGKVKALNNLAYFSSGAITLSITFIGYFINAGPITKAILLNKIFYSIPLLYVLFISWTLLFVSILLGTTIQFIIEKFLFNTHFSLMLRKARASQQSNGVWDFVGSDADNDAEKYRKMSVFMQWLAIACFVLGLLALMIFVMLVIAKYIQ